ncbi:MAG: glucokinase [Deltaproteobacteria bacterium]|nr:glucokinase [Deltaproteobacteria bacterium]
MNLLCGDVGGTSARLAAWRDSPATGGLADERHYPSAEHSNLATILHRWLSDTGVRPSAACLAVAGPVTDNCCVATNLPWVVDGESLARELGFPVRIVNDFYAAARGIALLGAGDLVKVGGGEPVPGAPVAVLGAGTGLGEAFIVGGKVVPGEGGHCELGASNEREARLVAWLVATEGRASWEHVLSGAGLVRLARFLALEGPVPVPTWLDEAGAPARVAATDPEAVRWFCELYGAEAGNMALRVLARGGVYVAGGIAPRMLPALQAGGFRRRFEAKGKLGAAIADVPAYVVTHPGLGLLGAAAELGAAQ